MRCVHVVSVDVIGLWRGCETKRGRWQASGGNFGLSGNSALLDKNRRRLVLPLLSTGPASAAVLH